MAFPLETLATSGLGLDRTLHCLGPNLAPEAFWASPALGSKTPLGSSRPAALATPAAARTASEMVVVIFQPSAGGQE